MNGSTYSAGQSRSAKRRLPFRVLALALVASGAAAQTGTPGDLKIFVLRGEGGINRIALGLVPDLVVEVRDSRDLPVEGAEVVFRAPATGPGGTFQGQPEYRARTNADGQTAALGFVPNSVEGRFQLVVEATAGDRKGQTVVNQINSARDIATTVDTPKRRSRKLLLWSLIGGAAAAAITIWATWDSTPSTVTLTPGLVTVGPPR